MPCTQHFYYTNTYILAILKVQQKTVDIGLGALAHNSDDTNLSQSFLCRVHTQHTARLRVVLRCEVILNTN